MSDRQPSDYEVNQVDPESIGPAEVPVRVEGPINARALPATAWVGNRWLVTDQIPPIKVSGRNPYRKRLLLVSETAGFFFGTSQAQCDGRGNCPFVVQNVVIELMHTEEVWVNNAASQLPVVSVIEEMWTN